VSFELAAGETLGLLGPNGAGKTTLVRLVLDLAKADSGQVRVLDGAPGDRSAHAVGYLPEERGLYPKERLLPLMTYLLSLNGLSRQEARQRSLGWLRRVGLETRARDRVGTLSKGMQQKVQLGIAHLHHPELLILDEPFTGLDPVSRSLVAEVVATEKARGAGVLISSHLLDQVELLCDRVVMINRGQVIKEGRVAALISEGRGRVIELEFETGAAEGPAASRGVEEADPAQPDLRLLDPLLQRIASSPESPPRYLMREGVTLARILSAMAEAKILPSSFSVYKPSLEALFVGAVATAEQAQTLLTPPAEAATHRATSATAPAPSEESELK